MPAHTLTPAYEGKGRISESEISLLYTVTSRTTRAMSETLSLNRKRERKEGKERGKEETQWEKTGLKRNNSAAFALLQRPRPSSRHHMAPPVSHRAVGPVSGIRHPLLICVCTRSACEHINTKANSHTHKINKIENPHKKQSTFHSVIVALAVALTQT